MNRLNFQSKATVEGIVPTPKRLSDEFNPRGKFKVQLVDKKTGEVLREEEFPNGVTNEGKDNVLSVHFHTGTKISTWYLGLIDDANFTALDAGDTYDDIDQAGNGWDEFTDYTDPANTDSVYTRPEWTPGAPSSQAITNGTVVEFDITGSGSVRGLFVVGGGTDPDLKGDHAAGSILWATALFTGGTVAVQDTQTLRVIYTVTAG